MIYYKNVEQAILPFFFDSDATKFIKFNSILTKKFFHFDKDVFQSIKNAILVTGNCDKNCRSLDKFYTKKK